MPLLEKDTMDGQGEKDQDTDKSNGATDVDHQQQPEAGLGGARTRRFLTRKSASNRMKAQSTLISSIKAM